MAHVREIHRKSGPRWEVIWTAPDGQKKYRVFAIEDEAREFANATPQRRRTGPDRTPVEVRIHQNARVDEAGCWIWQGRPSNAGYGQMTFREDDKTVTRSAHRVSYEAFVGPIPDGLVIDHLCRVRRCVNPDHLEVVTQRENILRSPIAQGALNARKTHCAQGHPYDDENTYVLVRPNYTARYCRTCMRTSSRKRRNAAKELAR